jgi:hypothetical protein
VRRPVQRAEERARGDGRVGGAQRTAPDAVGDQGADAALVTIALGDDAGAERRRQRVDGEMGGRSLDLVEQAHDMGRRHLLQPVGERSGIARRLRQRVEQPIERSILAEEENLLLAAEVVIQIAGRQIGGRGDIAHAGGGKAPGAEDPGRRAHDLDPP